MPQRRRHSAFIWRNSFPCIASLGSAHREYIVYRGGSPPASAAYSPRKTRNSISLYSMLQYHRCRKINNKHTRLRIVSEFKSSEFLQNESWNFPFKAASAFIKKLLSRRFSVIRSFIIPGYWLPKKTKLYFHHTNSFVFYSVPHPSLDARTVVPALTFEKTILPAAILALFPIFFLGTMKACPPISTSSPMTQLPLMPVFDIIVV